VTDGLGERWELEQIALRLWPSASLLQGLNTALFALLEKHRVRIDDVRMVRVGLSRAAFDMHGKLARYKAKFDALISAHYTAAVILHDRRLTLAQFEPARYDDPALRRDAAERIEIAARDDLAGAAATVAIELRDGSTLAERCEHPRGSPELPVSAAEIAQKFRAYAPTRLSSRRVDAVVDVIARIEELGSARELMDLLRFTAPASAAAG
jgi:2-methylcitrate dehydratase PrpD